MPGSKSSVTREDAGGAGYAVPNGDADAPGGRANQKRRTRQALIDAALALRESGRDPSFAEVAEHALVSRATAYRYFPSVEALLSESAAERAMQPLERVWRAGEDPEAAIGRAARELNRILADDEVGLHVMERSFMAVWLDGPGGARAPRPGRRLRYIRPIVDALKEELPPAARRRLVQALAMVMGTEAVLALRDVAGAGVDEALETSAWAARALLRQARAEAAQVKLRRGAVRAAPRRKRTVTAPARRREVT
jgi:AcrR family transcriptional regulator